VRQRFSGNGGMEFHETYQTIAGKMEFPSLYMAFFNWKPFLHYESVYRTMLCRSAVICTADALKRHERVNVFNLVIIISHKYIT